MQRGLLENHLFDFEKALEISLKRGEKKGACFKIRPEMLSSMITFIYFKWIYESFADGSIKDTELKEKEIDDMVDEILNHTLN